MRPGASPSSGRGPGVRAEGAIGIGVHALVGLVMLGGASANDVGERVYRERCAPCHGDSGRGDGPAAEALEPRPRNFREVGFWRDRTEQQLTDVVRRGKPGTLMAPFEGVLSDAEIEAVVSYVRSFRPGSAPGDGKVSDAGPGKNPAGRGDRP